MRLGGETVRIDLQRGGSHLQAPAKSERILRPGELWVVVVVVGAGGGCEGCRVEAASD